VPNVAEVRARMDYYQLDFPQVTRQQMTGVYTEQVLVVYAPFAIGILTKISLMASKLVNNIVELTH
jgi:hypothetical protein